MHGRHYFSPQHNGAKNHWIAWQCTFKRKSAKTKSVTVSQGRRTNQRQGVKRETQTARWHDEARLGKARTLLEFLGKQKCRLPPAEEVIRSISLSRLENGFFFQKIKAEQNFSIWYHLWIKRPTKKRARCAEPQERNDKVEQSANARETQGWTASSDNKFKAALCRHL